MLQSQKDELKQIGGLYPQNLINDLILAKLHDIIKKDYLNYKWKLEKTYNFGKYSLPIVFKGYMWRTFITIKWW